MKPTAIISWVVIVLISVALPVLAHLGERSAKPQTAAAGPDVQLELQGRYLLGAARTMPQQALQLQNQFDTIAKDSNQKIAAAILAGEVLGTKAAVDRLQGIADPAAESIFRFYVPELPADDGTDAAANFAAEYPWFYNLAKLHSRPATDAPRAAVLDRAEWTFRTAFVFIISAAFACAIGAALLLTGIILLATRWSAFRTLASRGPSHFYVESFAIYLVLFVLASLAIGILAPNVSLAARVLPLGLVVLFAAAWPLMRGVTWDDYRRDIGLHTGAGLFTEIGTGILGYLAALPVMAVGLGITYALTKLSGETSSHPIVNEVNQISPFVLLLVASVFAPLTEELMFRGILVSYLRSGVGVVMSGLISGLIFAAIHPQGWAAIPVLGSIGFALAIMRQWRDSLIASITAHAINNSIVLVGLLYLMS